MKHLIKLTLLILTAALMLSFASCKASNDDTTPQNTDAPQTLTQSETKSNDSADKILIVYFSQTGTTKGIAEKTSTITGGELFRITTTEAYPESYNELASIAKKQQDEKIYPQLSSHMDNIEQYNIIILAYPIWFDNLPMPVCSFLKEYDLSGKTIAPVSTSGSSAITNSLKELAELAPDAQIKSGLSLTSSNLNNADELINEWLDEISLK